MGEIRERLVFDFAPLATGCHCRPEFLNSPTYSFFFVSTEITG